MRVTRPERTEINSIPSSEIPALPDGTVLAVWVWIDDDGNVNSQAICVEPGQEYGEEVRDGFRQVAHKTIDLIVEGT